VTTAALALSFNATFPLQPGDITLWPGSTGAAMGGLIPNGDGAYMLAVPGVAAEGEVFVTVVKDGYAVRPATVRVPVHYPGPATGGGTPYAAKGVPVDQGNASIKAKFGVTLTGKAGVNAAFKELSAFIQKGGLAAGVIKLGDYIDLEGGLTVAAYYDAGFKSSDNWDTPLPDSKGKLSRLIVVGINSFQSVQGGYQYPDGTPPAHVVFQFQNIPHRHLMSTKDGASSKGGYPDSAMRQYLTGNFLDGLITAGVPEGVLWEPARMVSTRAKAESATDFPPAKIADKLWLPTAWEMTGTTTQYVLDEEATNQAWLEYYKNVNDRIKLDQSGKRSYWLASTTSKSDAVFASVDISGAVIASSLSVGAYSAIGVAPAFCVQ
jgi:hypothetical protein